MGAGVLKLKRTTVVGRGVSPDQKVVKANAEEEKAGGIGDEGHTEGSDEDDDIDDAGDGGEAGGEKVNDEAGKIVEGEGNEDRVAKGRKADGEKPNDPGGDQVKNPRAGDESPGRGPSEGDEGRNLDEVKGRVGEAEDQKGKEGSVGRERNPVVAGNEQQVEGDAEGNEKEGKPLEVDTTAIESYEFLLMNDTDNRHHLRQRKNKQSRLKLPTQRKKMNKRLQLHHQPNRRLEHVLNPLGSW